MSMDRSTIDAMREAAMSGSNNGTDVSALRNRPAVKPPVQLPWEARELVLKAESFKEAGNPNTGSLRVDLKFKADGLARPVFLSISLSGKNLNQVDRLVCKFTGRLLTDTVEVPTVGDYSDALRVITETGSFRAFVIQDENGYLVAPIGGSAGRVLWSKLS